jgi:hypothetical protein
MTRFTRSRSAPPPRLASIGTGGWFQSESQADFIGMDEGSTRSREETVARGMPRDVVEA